MRALIVIPARMAATRLPGKPLADIAGEPMIARCVAAALKSGVGPVAVAAGDSLILAPAEAAGARVVLTDPALPSGTDRIHAALGALDPDGAFDVIVNLQGDMPTIDPALIAACAQVLADSPQADIATLVSPSAEADDRANSNLVKAIVSWATPARGRCLYFTRADAPSGEGPIMRHVGIYAYRRAALEAFVAAAPSALEQRERLEQLRALELGLRIDAGLVADFPKGVDSPADLQAARAWFEETMR
jgi:3-deoxy-manno-octulosonate cytidylyltransferase (CMP-KDO synthetase)